MPRKKSTVQKSPFTLRVTEETSRQLQQLQKQLDRGSIAEVIRDAIEVYAQLLKARQDGIELFFEDRRTKDTGRIWLLPGPIPRRRPN